MMTTKRKNGVKQPGKPGGFLARPASRGVAFFLLGVLATWLSQVVVSSMHRHEGSVAKAKPALAPLTSTPHNTPLKPWGHLECTDVMLERPAESFTSNLPPKQDIHWLFKDYSCDQVKTFLQACPLTAHERALLTAPACCEPKSWGCSIRPPLEVVQDMSTAARQKIYGLLGQSELNYFQQNPFRFNDDDFETCLAQTKLSPGTAKLLRKLAYPSGGATCFADSQLLEQILPLEEMKPAAVALSRTAAVLMKLHVNADSDIDSLVKYWGAAGRGKVVRPLLESIATVPGGASISVAYFMPTFPRMRLYTYPNPDTEKSPRPPDCFWTAMNFFNTEPDHRFFDPEHIRSVLRTEYHTVQGEYQFGDLIMLMDEHGQALHMCVYVAEDIVFTKNGAGPLQPWVLMKLCDMKAQYPSDRPFQLVTYRRKTI
jgi:hypothetical protein